MSISGREKIIKNIRIVLVAPAVAENIGLCARVLKNTSFSTLDLVSPNVGPKSFQVARRAWDILEGARIFTTLQEAVGEAHFVFGTTRRKRAYTFSYRFEDILPFIVALAKKKPISIIFGKENFGLSKGELSLCDSIFYIPANSAFPSYNVAAACTIVCYGIFEYLERLLYVDSLDLAKRKDINSMFAFIGKVLARTTMSSEVARSCLGSLQRLFLRTHLTKNEVQLLKTIFINIKQRLK